MTCKVSVKQVTLSSVLWVVLEFLTIFFHTSSPTTFTLTNMGNNLHKLLKVAPGTNLWINSSVLFKSPHSGLHVSHLHNHSQSYFLGPPLHSLQEVSTATKHHILNQYKTFCQVDSVCHTINKQIKT